MNTYLPPRGMRDIFGEDAEIYEYVFYEFKRIAKLHGFKPVYTPTIEFFKLFAEKSGEEIRETMYVFKDKAGRVVTLRPEVTASIVRLYLRSLRGWVKPVKLYYVAQCFRYEEPQRGRYREFWQGGLEVIGVEGLMGDVEAAYAASRFLESIGVIHKYVVGNVAFHRAIMNVYGLPDDFQEHILHLIDKRDVDRALRELSGRSRDASNLLGEFLGIGLEEIEEFLNHRRSILGDHLDKLLFEYERLRGFIDILNKMGYEAEYDPLLVRGLAYYTGLIYEYKAKSGDLRISIGGGGRYDGLSTVYGGPYEYFTGLALGLDRIILALGNAKVAGRVTAAIIALPGIPMEEVFNVKKLLEEYGVSSSIIHVKKIRKGLSIASRKGYKYAIIMGVREFSEGKVSVKDLETGVQETVNIKFLPLYIILRV